MREWILYDGECPLCRGLVARFRETFEPRGFGLATLQEDWVRARLGSENAPVPGEMKVLARGGRVFGGPDALRYLASKLWWGWPFSLLASLPGFRHLLEREYRRIAANRLAFGGACPLPDTMIRENAQNLRLAACSSGSGFLIWILCTIFLPLANASWSIVHSWLLLAPLVLVPLGLRLLVLASPPSLQPGFLRAAFLLQPAAAGALLLAFFAPPIAGGSLALPWLGLCALLALAGAFRLLLGGFGSVAESSISFGMLFLPIGGAWLLLSLLRLEPMGFQEPIVLLTALHFHYTAFLAPLLLGLAGSLLQGVSQRIRTAYALSAIGLLGGTPLLALGWTVSSPAIKIVAIAAIVAGLATLAFLQLRRLEGIRDGRAEGLLGLSALSLLAGMALALGYGLSELLGASWISIPDMAIAHGLANGFGFSLCGLLGWNLEWKTK